MSDRRMSGEKEEKEFQESRKGITRKKDPEKKKRGAGNGRKYGITPSPGRWGVRLSSSLHLV